MRLSIVVLCVAAALAACSDKAGTSAPDAGQLAENCDTAGDEDGNGLADCKDPACATAPACRPVCGNGRVDPGEQCDDGNTANADGCDANCTLPACGNHVVDPGEQCDDGNTIDADGCEANCTLPACGNHVVDPGEQCDDGNTANGDGCDANCTLPACGNHIVDPGEQCDDGNTANGDGCEANCTLPACGNHIVDPGEQCDDGNTIDADGCEANCTLPACGNHVVDPGEQCDDGNTNNLDGCDNNCLATAITYLKASNTGAGDVFGQSIALSADGSTLAVGAHFEDSSATDVGGNQGNNSAPNAGAVYVFARNGTGWTQQAYIKASNTGAGDEFGFSIALSADGSTLAVGAPGEASSATGVGGNQSDNSASTAGAVYVFTRSGTAWSQQGYIKASNTDAGDEFGWSVALSADGSILAVGAPGEDSSATGVNGGQNNNSQETGAVYVFTRSGTAWSQQAYVKESNTGILDGFGRSVTLSADGTTLAVGAPSRSQSSGAGYVFTRSGTAWSEQAYITVSNADPDDQFGFSVALSSDGSTLAVGAPNEASAATGIDGNQADNSAAFAGAVYVFTRSGTAWSQHAYIKASNTDPDDGFGLSVALSSDGSILAVGAVGESSAAIGIGGTQTNNSALTSGAVYLFAQSATTWSQRAYIKASNPGASDEFGWNAALSADGASLAVSAVRESSAATGIGGNQADNSASSAGAVYVFR